MSLDSKLYARITIEGYLNPTMSSLGRMENGIKGMVTTELPSCIPALRETVRPLSTSLLERAPEIMQEAYADLQNENKKFVTTLDQYLDTNKEYCEHHLETLTSESMNERIASASQNPNLPIVRDLLTVRTIVLLSQIHFWKQVIRA